MPVRKPRRRRMVVPQARKNSTVPQARKNSTVPQARKNSTVPQARKMSTVMARASSGLIAAAVVLTGCGQHQATAAPIRVASAYVMQSTGASAVAAYLIIANSGPADRLLNVRSSAGGQVLMVGPGPHGLSAASALSQLTITGHAVTKLDPGGYHLEIVHPGRLHVGTDVTLTLVFAHAGTMRVPAQVNNPATSSSGYFGP